MLSSSRPDIVHNSFSKSIISSYVEVHVVCVGCLAWLRVFLCGIRSLLSATSSVNATRAFKMIVGRTEHPADKIAQQGNLTLGKLSTMSLNPKNPILAGQHAPSLGKTQWMDGQLKWFDSNLDVWSE